MLVEWVQQIGSVAGLNASNTRLSSGAVGVPESRIEMEVVFESLAEWEAFLAAIPAAEHVQWSQRMQPNVVDGSPTWQLFRTMDVWSSSSSQPASSSSSRQSRPALVMADKVPSEDIAAWLAATSGNRDAADHHHQQQQQQQSQQGAGPAAAEPGAPQPDLPLDWKGEPMRLNPGDKLPFKFL